MSAAIISLRSRSGTLAMPEESHPAIIRVAQYGDVILEVGRDSFSVSSHVLREASDAFGELLPKRSVGENTTHNAEPTRILLIDEDDSTAMFTILTVLHNRVRPDIAKASAREFLNIVLYCVKYGCQAPLELLISTRIRNLPDREPGWSISSTDYSIFLAAAYQFGNEDCFRTAYAKAIKNSLPNDTVFWTGLGIKNLLPPYMEYELEKHISMAQALIRKSLELSSDRIPVEFTMAMIADQCLECEYSPGDTCPHRLNSLQTCRHDYRVTSYYETLQALGVWPTWATIDTLSISDIVFKLGHIDPEIWHNCDGLLLCPLRRQLMDLSKAMRCLPNIISENEEFKINASEAFMVIGQEEEQPQQDHSFLVPSANGGPTNGNIWSEPAGEYGITAEYVPLPHGERDTTFGVGMLDDAVMEETPDAADVPCKNEGTFDFQNAVTLPPYINGNDIM